MALPNEAAVGKALEFLQQTDEEFGGLKGNMKRTEYMLKHFKAVAMVESGEKSQAAKETEAYVSDKFLEAVEEHASAVAEYETMSARRQRAVLTIEVWRSLNSARKQGANI